MHAYQFSLASLLAVITGAGFLSRFLPGIVRDAASLWASGDGHWLCLTCVAAFAIAAGVVSLFKS